MINSLQFLSASLTYVRVYRLETHGIYLFSVQHFEQLIFIEKLKHVNVSAMCRRNLLPSETRGIFAFDMKYFNCAKSRDCLSEVKTGRARHAARAHAWQAGGFTAYSAPKPMIHTDVSKPKSRGPADFGACRADRRRKSRSHGGCPAGLLKRP
jgi:hypothetical protein